MARLAETYIHLRPYELTRRKVGALGDQALQAAIKTAQEVYGGDVTIELLLEEGSAKFWARVNGVLLAGHIAYGMTADWKAFKEQAAEWMGQAREFGDKVITAVIKQSDASPEQVYRTERRLKTPGKLTRLVEDLERLNDASGSMPKSQLVKQLEELVRSQLEALKAELTAEEMRRLVQALRFENLPPLDQLPRERSVDPIPKAAIRVDKVLPERKMFDHLMDADVAPPPQPTTRKLVYRKSAYVRPVTTQIEEAVAEIKKEPPGQTLFIGR